MWWMAVLTVLVIGSVVLGVKHPARSRLYAFATGIFMVLSIIAVAGWALPHTAPSPVHGAQPQRAGLGAGPLVATEIRDGTFYWDYMEVMGQKSWQSVPVLTATGHIDPALPRPYGEVFRLTQEVRHDRLPGHHFVGRFGQPTAVWADWGSSAKIVDYHVATPYTPPSGAGPYHGDIVIQCHYAHVLPFGSTGAGPAQCTVEEVGMGMSEGE